jgi:hypothetical protein
MKSEENWVGELVSRLEMQDRIHCRKLARYEADLFLTKTFRNEVSDKRKQQTWQKQGKG